MLQVLCSILVILRGSPPTLERNTFLSKWCSQVCWVVWYKSAVGSAKAQNFKSISRGGIIKRLTVIVSQQERDGKRGKWWAYWKDYWQRYSRVKGTNGDDEAPEDEQEWEEVNIIGWKGWEGLLLVQGELQLGSYGVVWRSKAIAKPQPNEDKSVWKWRGRIFRPPPPPALQSSVGASHWPTSIASLSSGEHGDEGDLQHQPLGHRAEKQRVRTRTRGTNGDYSA